MRLRQVLAGAATGGDLAVCPGAEQDPDAAIGRGTVLRALSAAAVNALRTDPETGFAPKATYVLTGETDSSQVIYATSSYSSKTGKFTVKGKLPLGKAFSATVAAVESGSGDLALAPISAADADGARYLLTLVPGGDGAVRADGFEPGGFEVDSERYDFWPGYETLPATFAAAVYDKYDDSMPVRVAYSSGGDESFKLRASGTKYVQVSFDGGTTWTKKADAKYDNARGIATLSFANGATKYALDLLYARPGLLIGQMRRQSNPVTDKNTKKTTYTTEYGKAVVGEGRLP